MIPSAHSGIGEWTELAEDYCGITDAPVSLLIFKLQQIKHFLNKYLINIIFASFTTEIMLD